MTLQVEQFRHLMNAINPCDLGRADYIALLALARRIPIPKQRGGGRGECSRRSA